MKPASEEQQRAKKLKLAQELFRAYYARCFWHLRPDLEITESTIPLLVSGLRKHGDRAGMLAAAQLLEE